ncbi:UDP-N-acetylmuramoyl-tripeptide--D-alanyl-D-alanine ligase [Bizionia echini]|uniref:UDP-N-acetylmuramoyl-tripeptide--D-alanyl-D-alanine ligase n=1 Tax=Bizionia echini TaxID=649333 RepID=A0A1I5DQY9_9FLAO|nr:UDP-N-acetylmuramoyl-tripeptide--D-alanyl-D-alanine ligase [Bizionia echini]SFO01672.1 UDP-N-acetylmuramoyl-tripeptide--D-alanyl-D-alanine ligase [Bizionia echini]
MITIPLFEASVAIGGRPNKSISAMDYISNVTQISTEVKEGTLFVALIGKKFDGHDFVIEAQKKGAIAAIVEREIPNIEIPQIIVPSTEMALGDLGRIWRCRLETPLIAVTGSVGKTTTKELIAHILSKKFKTHKSRKNFNNQLGLPIELLRLERNHECSVVEFGMRGFNQINYLSKIARPNIGVITNIGLSHIGILKSRKNIAKAKAEIFQGMDGNGIAILNRDDEFFELISNQCHCRIISYGTNKDSDIHISDIELVQNIFPKFKLNGNEIILNNCTGEYNAYNSAVGYAIGLEMGMQINDIIEQLNSFKQPERRGTSIKLNNQAIILDSTYNAAPDSIIANLETISKRKRKNHRLICIIGEMLELGSHSIKAHKLIGKRINSLENKVDLLITVGDFAKYINQESSVSNKYHFKKSNLIDEKIYNSIQADDIILIQGSNSVRLDFIVEKLESIYGVYRKKNTAHNTV